MKKNPNQETGTLMRDVIFGINDGIVSTLALIAGLSAALLENRVIIIGTLVQIFASAFSMAAGTYISSKSEHEVERAEGIKNITESTPRREGILMFISFLLAGSLLLIPYFFTFTASPLYAAVVIGLGVLFLTGVIKTHFTGRNAVESGVEMLIMGGAAAAISYGIGGLVGVLV